jgi:hypothetical protein
LRRLSPCLLAVVAVLALAACGSTEQIHKGEVTSQAQKFFDGVARKNGQASFPKITCPDDLKAEKGATTRCSAKGTDGTLGITVTVKDVHDNGVTLTFKGDPKLTK